MIYDLYDIDRLVYVLLQSNIGFVSIVEVILLQNKCVVKYIHRYKHSEKHLHPSRNGILNSSKLKTLLIINFRGNYALCYQQVQVQKRGGGSVLKQLLYLT